MALQPPPNCPLVDCRGAVASYARNIRITCMGPYLVRVPNKVFLQVPHTHILLLLPTGEPFHSLNAEDDDNALNGPKVIVAVLLALSCASVAVLSRRLNISTSISQTYVAARLCACAGFAEPGAGPVAHQSGGPKGRKFQVHRLKNRR